MASHFPLTLLAAALLTLSAAHAHADDTATALSDTAAAKTPAAPASPWSLSGRLDLDSMVNLSGGIRRQASSSALLQWGGSYDTGVGGQWPGGLFEFSLEGVRSSGDPATSIGAVQIPSNEWAPNFLRVYQLSWKQDFGPAFVRAGIMDLNQYFEASDQSTLLHNSSDGMAPGFMANFNGPSFPNPGLAAMVEGKLGEDWSARGGVWQGNPPSMSGALSRGALSIAEVERDWKNGDTIGSDLKFGAWHFTRPDNTASQSLSGAYLVGETRWKAGTRQWGAFVLAGSQPAAQIVGSYSGVTEFVGAGLLATGLLESRPQDQASVGVNRVNLRGASPETALEAVYSWQISDTLALQPDLQYFSRPGGAYPDAWVAGARLHLAF